MRRSAGVSRLQGQHNDNKCKHKLNTKITKKNTTKEIDLIMRHKIQLTKLSKQSLHLVIQSCNNNKKKEREKKKS